MPSLDGTEPADRAGISTHVLDTVTGAPAADLCVRLERRDDAGWSTIAEGRTDADGRLRHWVPTLRRQAGGYRLTFFTEPYLGGGAFFPEVTVTFHVSDPDGHYHIPLLLSPYGYTTYRGS